VPASVGPPAACFHAGAEEPMGTLFLVVLLVVLSGALVNAARRL